MTTAPRNSNKKLSRIARRKEERLAARIQGFNERAKQNETSFRKPGSLSGRK